MTLPMRNLWTGPVRSSPLRLIFLLVGLLLLASGLLFLIVNFRPIELALINAGNSILNGQTAVSHGTLDHGTGAVPSFITSESGPALGPLYVLPENPRYFTDGTGRAILLTGSHFWLNLQDGDPNFPSAFDYTAWLDFLDARNHNFFRLWSWEQAHWVAENTTDYYFAPNPYSRTGSCCALDGGQKFDLTQFDQEYFDRLRQRVTEAGNRGMYVSVMLFNGWSVGKNMAGSPWMGHPYNQSNNINSIDGDPNGNGEGEETHSLANPAITALQESYVKKVIDTVNDLDNVLYEISNESYKYSENWQYHMIDFIKSYESTQPKQHPVGMTVEYPQGENADLFASNADWISPNGDLNNPSVADGSKVILADTDHLCGICGNRVWVWEAFMRGENPLFMDQYDDSYKLDGGGYDPNNPNDVSLRLNLGFVRAYADRMDLAAMEPLGQLVSSGYALANPTAAGEYLVYLPQGSTISELYRILGSDKTSRRRLAMDSSVSVDLSGTPATLNIEWFNPANGFSFYGGTVQGGGIETFNAPFTGDAVLYLYSGAPPPNLPYKTFLPINIREQHH
jgi:Family of unknown function (DUF6298)